MRRPDFPHDRWRDEDDSGCYMRCHACYVEELEEQLAHRQGLISFTPLQVEVLRKYVMRHPLWPDEMTTDDRIEALDEARKKLGF